MATPGAPTIPLLKQAFITNQTSLLSQPLTASRAWSTANDASGEPIPERVVEEALHQLNQSIQQHCHRLYAPQATRNIAEQINSLYVKDAERRVGGAADAEGGVGRELDLTDGDALDALPPTWESEKEVTAYPMEARRYVEAVEQLAQLNEKRKQLKDQIAKLNRLKTIVEPLQTSEGGAGVQENIITRNGAIEKELERMRFLLARVGGRVNALPKPTGNQRVQKLEVPGDGDFGAARKRRVDEFLENPNVFPS